MPDDSRIAQLLSDPTLGSLIGGAKRAAFGQLNPVAMGEDVGRVAQHLATLPQRAFTSADTFQRTGEYDPAPIVEAAGMMVGSPLTPRGALGSSAGAPKAFQQLEEAAAKASQDYTKSLIPAPRTWMEDLHYRTQKLPRQQVLDSDPLWGKARQLAESEGKSFSESYKTLADSVFRKKGENPLSDAELTNIMMQAVQAGIK